MERVNLRENIPQFLKKYKYVALIVLLGLFLMLLPTSSEKKAAAQPQPTEPASQQESIDETLCAILSQVKGAGRVEVMLTKAAGEQTLYQTDDDMTTGEQNAETHRDTVIVSDAQRNQTGLIQQINPPQYLGAIIVCQGADDPNVRLAIVEAVSKVTGLGANRISVLKMK